MHHVYKTEDANLPRLISYFRGLNYKFPLLLRYLLIKVLIFSSKIEKRKRKRVKKHTCLLITSPGSPFVVKCCERVTVNQCGSRDVIESRSLFRRVKIF